MALNGKIAVIGESHVSFFGGHEKIYFKSIPELTLSGGGYLPVAI